MSVISVSRFLIRYVQIDALVNTVKLGDSLGKAGEPIAMAAEIPEPDHELLLRIAYEEARKARESGNHPFAAVLVGADGQILMTQHNAYQPHGDMTGHAERVLMTRASTTYSAELLRGASMYTSAEPCAMCAGAAYWTGIKRVVYGLSERRLKTITGDHPENPTLDLPCRDVFASGQRHVEVIGPLLEEEGADLHEGVWD
jgi:tRNA(Arg) A34 adenosine deaminase TadA